MLSQLSYAPVYADTSLCLATFCIIPYPDRLVNNFFRFFRTFYFDISYRRSLTVIYLCDIIFSKHISRTLEVSTHMETGTDFAPRTDEKALRRVILELADEFDKICKQHGLRYMLFAGSALGAVRHGGFIPWDDDFDVIMPREDYERFLNVAPSELNPSRYFLQCEFSEHWPMTYSKLRRCGTAYIEKFTPKDPLIHQGIFIDIFPLDRLGRTPLMRAAQYAAARVVTASALYRRGYATDSLTRRAAMRLCRRIPQSPLIRLVRGGSVCGKSRMVHTFFAAKARYHRTSYPAEWFEGKRTCLFEGREYPIPKEIERMLERIYGDYMTPPPPAEQTADRHAVIIDADRPYTEYLELQQKLFRPNRKK